MSKHSNVSKGREEKSVGMPAEPAVTDGPAGISADASAGASPAADVSRNAASESAAMDAVTAELEAARKEVARLTSEVADLNEKYLRKLADEVNFRKRMVREKEDAQKFGVSSLLSDLIPVLDDFDRGLASTDGNKSYEHLREGVILIRKQLSQMLENKYALKRFESRDTVFDPNRHEALFAEPADVEEAMVSEEYLPGYSLHDRILRTAKVRVKIPAPNRTPVVDNVLEEKESGNGEPAQEAGQA